MPRPKYSLLAAAGLLLLALTLSMLGPKRVMAALGYTPIRDIDTPALQPFQKSFSLTPTSVTNAAETQFTVPPNKRLVLEFISGLMYSNATGNIYVGTVRSNEDGPQIYVPLLQPTASLYPGGITANQPIRLYAEPGSTVYIEADFNPSPYVQDARVTLTGYYVNVP